MSKIHADRLRMTNELLDSIRTDGKYEAIAAGFYTKDFLSKVKKAVMYCDLGIHGNWIGFGKKGWHKCVFCGFKQEITETKEQE